MVKAEKPLARKEPKPPVLWKPPKKGKGQKLQWEPGWDAPSYAAVAAGGRGKPNPPEVHEISSADEEEEEADSSADEAMGTEEEEDRQKAGTRGKWGRFRRQPQPSPPHPHRRRPRRNRGAVVSPPNGNARGPAVGPSASG